MLEVGAICVLMIGMGIVFLTVGRASQAKTVSKIGKSLFAAVSAMIVWELVCEGGDMYFPSIEAALHEQWGLPFIVAGGVLGVFLLLIWKPFGAKARRVAAACLAGAAILASGGVAGAKFYHNSRPTIPDEDYERLMRYGGRPEIDLKGYEPFRENTLAQSLDWPSSLRLADHLPRMEGATALYPLYASFARAVYPEEEYPVYGWKSTVGCSMTSGAFEKLIDGEADVIFLMGVSEDQLRQAEKKGVELNLTPIGREAFVFFVNSRNAAESLSAGDIRGIYSGRITNWRAVGGKNASIRPYQRSPGSGSQTMLLEIMGDAPLMAPPAEYVQEFMYGMVKEVAAYKNYKSALGYSFQFYVKGMLEENQIKILAIDGIEPTYDSIASGAYPFAGDFYAVTAVRGPKTEEDSERMRNTEKLIEWILSPQGQILVAKTGYVPLQK